MVIAWFKMKIRAQICGEDIQNLADAPSFCHTTSPQVGPGDGSKTLKHYYVTRYDLKLKYIIQYSTDKKGF